jgi:hypothetical protein
LASWIESELACDGWAWFCGEFDAWFCPGCSCASAAGDMHKLNMKVAARGHELRRFMKDLLSGHGNKL